MAPPLETDGSDQGTWREWARHVLLELTRLNDTQRTVAERIQDVKNESDTKAALIRQEIQTSVTALRADANKEISDLKVELAMLKVKAGLWGAVGAAIPILITLAVAIVIKLISK